MHKLISFVLVLLVTIHAVSQTTAAITKPTIAAILTNYISIFVNSDPVCLPTMSSVDDLLAFMKESEEKRELGMKALEEKLTIERDKDKKELTSEMSNLTTKLTELVKTGVKKEIETAVKPIEELQNTLLAEQKSMRVENSSLVHKVLELEKKLATNSGDKPASESCHSVSTSVPSVSTESNPPEEQNVQKMTVKAAKKILGFSLITATHLQQAVEEHGIDPLDETKAKVYSIFDFLHYEMKIPEKEIKAMKILRTFRSVNQPDSGRLYAEFEEEASANLINLYVRNLRPGRNVDIWIPPSLFQRFRGFDNACYNIRTGPGNFKAKVKYGVDDFVLIKKSPYTHSWVNVVPENISPFDPSPPGHTTASSSPPPGRDNRNKRKERSPVSSPSKSKVSRASSPELTVEPESKENEEAEVERENLAEIAQSLN